MNPAPASASDLAVFRKAYLEKLGADMDRQREIVASAAYKEGDPEAVAARYRIHFKPALKRPEDYEKLMATMKAGFISQGKEGIVKARAVEDRLMRDTWQVDGYDLLPKLRGLSIPTLVISGDHDFIPGEIAAHIARAIPNAQAGHAQGLRALRLSRMPWRRSQRVRRLLSSHQVDATTTLVVRLMSGAAEQRFQAVTVSVRPKARSKRLAMVRGRQPARALTFTTTSSFSDPAVDRRSRGRGDIAPRCRRPERAAPLRDAPPPRRCG